MDERSEKLSQMQGRLYEAFLREVTQSRLRAEDSQHYWSRSRVLASVGNFHAAYSELASQRKMGYYSIDSLTQEVMLSFRHTADWEEVKEMSVLDFLLKQGYLEAARRLVLTSPSNRYYRWRYLLRIYQASQDPGDLKKARDQLKRFWTSYLHVGGSGEPYALLLQGIMSIAQASGSKEDLDWGERNYQKLKKIGVLTTASHAEYWQRRASITGEKRDIQQAQRFGRKLAKGKAIKKAEEEEKERKEGESLFYLIRLARDTGDEKLLLEVGEKVLKISSAENEEYFELIANLMEATNDFGLTNEWGDDYRFRTF